MAEDKILPLTKDWTQHSLFLTAPHTNSNITLKMRMEKNSEWTCSFGNEDSISAASEMGFEIGVQSWGEKVTFLVQ